MIKGLFSNFNMSKSIGLMGAIAVLFFGPLIAIPELFPEVREKLGWEIFSTYGSLILWGLAMFFYFRAIYLKFQAGKQQEDGNKNL